VRSGAFIMGSLHSLSYAEGGPSRWGVGLAYPGDEDDEVREHYDEEEPNGTNALGLPVCEQHPSETANNGQANVAASFNTRNQSLPGSEDANMPYSSPEKAGGSMGGAFIASQLHITPERSTTDIAVYSHILSRDAAEISTIHSAVIDLLETALFTEHSVSVKKSGALSLHTRTGWRQREAEVIVEQAEDGPGCYLAYEGKHDLRKFCISNPASFHVAVENGRAVA